MELAWIITNIHASLTGHPDGEYCLRALWLDSTTHDLTQPPQPSAIFDLITNLLHTNLLESQELALHCISNALGEHTLFDTIIFEKVPNLIEATH